MFCQKCQPQQPNCSAIGDYKQWRQLASIDRSSTEGPIKVPEKPVLGRHPENELQNTPILIPQAIIDLPS